MTTNITTRTLTNVPMSGTWGLWSTTVTVTDAELDTEAQP